jgi:protein-S-isoprenylcysteine O-methyltransferase Ste14
VRNPIYLAALLVVLGEAALFGSLWVLAYAGAMAVCFHLFVAGDEEPALRRRFGPGYLAYQRAVPRWIPRRPHPAGGKMADGKMAGGGAAGQVAGGGVAR